MSDYEGKVYFETSEIAHKAIKDEIHSWIGTDFAKNDAKKIINKLLTYNPMTLLTEISVNEIFNFIKSNKDVQDSILYMVFRIRYRFLSLGGTEYYLSEYLNGVFRPNWVKEKSKDWESLLWDKKFIKGGIYLSSSDTIMLYVGLMVLNPKLLATLWENE